MWSCEVVDGYINPGDVVDDVLCCSAGQQPYPAYIPSDSPRAHHHVPAGDWT